MSEELSVFTKSVTTAGAILAATGIEPRVLRRRDGSITLEFPPECEPALKAYLHGKRRVDALIESESA